MDENNMGDDELVEMEVACLTLSDLPQEVLENILGFVDISCRDVCNVSLGCSKLRDVTASNKLWKTKFQQRWPDLKLCYDKQLVKSSSGCIIDSWKKECKYRFECGKAIRRTVGQMSKSFYKDEEISCEAFAELERLLEKYKFGYYFVVDELMAIINDGRKDFNLTQKFYAEKALRFVRHIHLRVKWVDFLDLPEQEQSLEAGSVLLAQWCQPTLNIGARAISAQLDTMADMVKEELSRREPSLPVVKTALNHAKLSDSTWSPQQCRTILHCLNHVLYKKLGFRGNQQSYYDAENSYVNMVMNRKTGIPISLCLMYTAIAHRLGVVCEPVNFPAHFLLRWKEHPTLTKGQEYTYIDVFNCGRFMPERECVNILPTPFAFGQSIYEAVTPVRVFQRMAHNLVEVGRQQNNTSDCLLCLRNALELLLLLQPDDTDSRLLLARVYLHLNINLHEVMSSLQHIQATDPTRSGIVAYMFQICQGKMEMKKCDKDHDIKNLRPQHRTHCRDVAFPVGMVMTHKRYNYTCVIYGWDPQCAADNDWIVQMGVNNLSKKQYQPFYHVLVADGSNRYAAQENLEVAARPTSLQHAEIGRYFSEFTGTHYVPNAEKAVEYPHDEPVRQALVQQYYAADAETASSVT